MTLMMKENFIFFVIISYLFVLEHICYVNAAEHYSENHEDQNTAVDIKADGDQSENEQDFRVVTVKHVREKIRVNEEKLEAHYFHLLNDKERKELCINVKEAAAFDGMGKNAVIYKPIECSITHNSGEEEAATIVLKCDTIPISYLRMQDEKDVKKIFIRTNEYEKEESFSFNVREVKSEVNETSEEIPPDDPLSNLLQETRLQICIAAKKHIKKGTKKGPIPVLESSEVEKPKVFQMEFLDKMNLETHIAVDCLSKPAMYVYFHETENKIEVALVNVANVATVTT